MDGSRIPKFPPKPSVKRQLQNENLPTPNVAKRQKIEQTPLTGRIKVVRSNTCQSKAPASVLSAANKFSEVSKRAALRAPLHPVPAVRESMPVLRSTSSMLPPAAPKAKRPAWDLKGRMQDMEEVNKNLRQYLSNCSSRINALEEDKQNLNQDIETKSAQTAEASEQVKALNDEISKLKGELQEKELKNRELSMTNKQVSQQNEDLLSENTALKAEVSSSKSLITTMTANQSCIQTQLEATKMLLDQSNCKIKDMEKQIAELLDKNMRQEKELQARETERRMQHNMIMELKGNIRVFCRIRPPLPSEIEESVSMAQIHPRDDKTLDVVPTASKGVQGTHEFTFDHVFCNNATQEHVFAEISQLVQSTLDGYNVCIFAYGQTGSGKTYTMEGPENADCFLSLENSQLGMIPRSVNHIFQRVAELEEKNWKYTMEASFIEIYNETIRDLLVNSTSKCEIKKTASKGNDCIVSNLTTVPVTSAAQVYNLLRKAKIHRSVAATKCNEYSSRSHYIFQMKLTGENSLTTDKCEGILNLIDLAGSERVKDSGSSGDRFTEAKNINKSLSNLGNVIMALSQKADHIPYRNSKLTHLLMNSLGGNSKTMMFVNINPCNDSLVETINSLRFASKVNQCNIGTAQKRVK